MRLVGSKEGFGFIVGLIEGLGFRDPACNGFWAIV